MEYVSAEEFLKQDKEVQCIFMEWWIPRIGDLFSWIQPRIDLINTEMKNQTTLQVIDYDVMSSIENNMWSETYTGHVNSLTDYVIPLLTEGQLRKFIEDMSNFNNFKFHIEVKKIFWSNKYNVKVRNGDLYREFKEVDSDLLQTYWKVALEIAKEEIKEEIQND